MHLGREKMKEGKGEMQEGRGKVQEGRGWVTEHTEMPSLKSGHHHASNE